MQVSTSTGINVTDFSVSENEENMVDIDDIFNLLTNTNEKSQRILKDKSQVWNAIGFHKGYQARRKVKALSLEIIKDDLMKSCGCVRECNTEILTPDLVLRWRSKYHTLVQGFQQQTKLLEMMRESLYNDGIETCHFIEGRQICRKAWYSTVLKVSRTTYLRTLNKLNAGLCSIEKTPRKLTHGERGCIAKGYMQWYVEMMGDRSPESERVLLPCGVTVTEMYHEYARMHENERLVKYSQFHSIWKTNFRNVTYQKHCRMSKCNVCMLAKHFLQQNLSQDVRLAILHDRNEHLLRQQKERESYYKRRADAIANLNDKLSCIADGMDQSKTDLPHFKGWENPKACDGSKVLKTHIVGVLCHGRSMYTYIDLHQYPHDTNLTLNCVLNSLVSEAKQGKLPQILYIQLDNCGRENKNKYFLGMLALLVAKRYVTEVFVNFLMVGHTHEDIDQRFSKISKSLKHSDAKTLPELLEIINRSIENGMNPQMVWKVWDIKNWIAPFLTDLHNHSFPHQYWITADRNNKVGIRYKNWSTDDNFLPRDGPINIFKEENGEQLLPEGMPQEVLPDFAPLNLEATKEIIQKMKDFFTGRQFTWWMDFLDSPCRTDPSEWYLKDLVPCIQETAAVPMGSITSSPLALFMEKERKIPEVYTGKKKSARSSEDTCNSHGPGKTSVSLGYMVAFRDCNENIRIGKVKSIDRHAICINLYRGTVNGTWSPCTSRLGNLIEMSIDKDRLYKNCIFHLTKSDRLPIVIQQQLK